MNEAALQGKRNKLRIKPVKQEPEFAATVHRNGIFIFLDIEYFLKEGPRLEIVNQKVIGFGVV